MTSEPNGAPSCGCPEFRASRRTFIKGLGAAFGSAVVTGVVGDVFTQTAFGATSGGNVLVVLSLRGGADGLSMVVPHGDPGYAAARPGIAIPTDRLVAADAMFGLHPQFAPLVPMWEAGRFGAVHAVGLPQPNRSHFSAMEVVEDADPSSAERRGWINRVVGMIGDGGPDQAMQIGSSLAPTSLVGPAPAMAVSRLADIKLPGDNDPDFQAAQRRALSSMWTGVRGPMGRAVAATLSTTIELADLAADDGPPLNGASYPDGLPGAGAAADRTAGPRGPRHLGGHARPRGLGPPHRAGHPPVGSDAAQRRGSGGVVGGLSSPTSGRWATRSRR